MSRRSRASRPSARRSAGWTPTFDTVETDEDDTAVILYTSGTTGQPKGAELRHRNMRDNALLAESIWGVDPENPERYLCVLPLFHSFGQTVIQNAGAATGSTVVMLPRFEAGPALQLMQDEGITFFAGVPTMYWGLLGALKEASRRQTIRSTWRSWPRTCGSPPPVARRCRSRCTRTSRTSSA